MIGGLNGNFYTFFYDVSTHSRRLLFTRYIGKYEAKIMVVENAPDPLYKHDYIVALIEHAFSWTFMIMLPVGIYTIFYDKSIVLIIIVFLINWIIHAIVDHLKANVKVINLVTDQVIHILQIIVTWICLIK